MRALAFLLCALLSAVPLPSGARGALAVGGDWPRAGVEPQRVTFASASPFLPSDIGAGPERSPPTAANATYYPAAGASAADPAPAVILLHGAGGVSASREGTYAAQFAAQGVASLVIDVFAARRDRASGFVERLIRITETMALADAFAGLAWLDGRPEVDVTRVVLIGFSYGGMASIFAAYRQVAERFAPEGPYFAAHVAFYGPCIARFADPATTGAPVLMLWGGRDDIIDPERCREIADDLDRGGSPVTLVEYPDAYHRWDGSSRRWHASRHIADCRLRIDRANGVTDLRTGLPMAGPVTRRLILAACANAEGYWIGGDEAVRRRSNAALARFLNPVLFPRPGD